MIAVLSLASAGCREEARAKPEAGDAKPSGSADAARQVRLEPVRELPLEESIEISGTLAVDEQVSVGAKVAGRLGSISVDVGTEVKSGQPIAQLETTEYSLRVDQASAALAQARAQLGLAPEGTDTVVDVENTAIVRQARATANEANTNAVRARALAKEGITTGMQLDAAEANAVRAETALQAAMEEVRIREATMSQRRSELRLAKQQLADTVVRSPLDGVVQMRIANVGQYLAAGAPVAQIVRIDPLRLRAAVPEREARKLRVGQLVRVELDSDPTPYSGTVARLAPSLETQNRSLLVEADIPNPGGLRPGSFARSRVVVASKPAATVSKSAVVAFAGLQKVITVENGKAVEKRVTLGRSVGDRVEILNGVKVGDSVVAQPGALQQGQPVRVVPGS